jgi:hypothetical protein
MGGNLFRVEFAADVSWVMGSFELDHFLGVAMITLMVRSSP